MLIGEGFKENTGSFAFLERVVPSFRKRERHFPFDAVNMPRSDQSSLHYGR